MTQTAGVFLSLSIALLAGLLLSRLAKKVQLPAVTAYLISGVLIGPFVLGALGVPGIGITAEQLGMKCGMLIGMLFPLAAVFVYAYLLRERNRRESKKQKNKL